MRILVFKAEKENCYKYQKQRKLQNLIKFIFLALKPRNNPAIGWIDNLRKVRYVYGTISWKENVMKQALKAL